MERLVEFLKQKNRYLKQFQDLNQVESANFANFQFDTLESFYQVREDILGKIRVVDENISLMQNEPNLLDPTREQKILLEELLRQKEELVKNILAQDLEVLSYIEQAKSEIIRELQAVRRNRKAVGAYKSRRVIPLLDEEL